MTDFTGYRSQRRDIQDHVERGLWGDIEYVDGAGASLKIRGTGTIDEEVPLLNLGYSFRVAADSQNEMVMLALGSDVNDKVALATIARDLQHPWEEGQGGVQHPTDPDRRIEFNGDETWIKDGVYVYGHDRAKTVTVDGDNVTVAMNGNRTLTIAGDDVITIQGDGTINIEGDANITAGGAASVTAGGDVAVNPGGDVRLNADTRVAGDLRVSGTIQGDGAGGITVNGPATVNGSLTASGDADFNGAAVNHNGTNIGDAHAHGGVTPGGGTTGGPG